MKLNLHVFIGLVLSGGLAAETPAPVLEWSASHGGTFEWATAMAFGADGRTVIAGNGGETRTDALITQLGADGLPNGCSARLGSSGIDTLRAMAVGNDGSIYVTGDTDGRDFPVTAGVVGVQPEPSSAGRWGFLAKLGACGEVRYATYLPGGGRPVALAASIDGSVVLVDSERNVFRVDPDGRRVLGRRVWNGEFRALAMDAQGRPVLAGRRGSQAVVTQFSADLEQIVFDMTVGEGPESEGTALLTGADGSVWMAGTAMPGPNRAENLSATLTLVRSNGQVAFHRVVESPAGGTLQSRRVPKALGMGPDGRIWMAIAGRTSFPQTFPEHLRVSQYGVSLRSFTATGEGAGGDTFIPGGDAGQHDFLAAISGGGRMLVGNLRTNFPRTVGSGMSGAPVISFDLKRFSAPVIRPDRDLATVDVVNLGTAVTIPARSVRFSGGEGLRYFAAMLPDGATGTPAPSIPSPAVATPDIAGQLPASVRLERVPGGVGDGVLVFLVPGAQGVAFVSVRLNPTSAVLRRSLSTPLETPRPGDQKIRSSLRVSLATTSGETGELALPCTFMAETQWLRLGQSAGVIPIEIPLEANPGGLPTGVHTGVIRMACGTFQSTIPLGLRIGPLPQFEPVGEIEAVVGQPVTRQIEITSSSDPFEFTAEASESWMRVEPVAGRTPQSIQVTATLPAAIGSQQILPGVRVNTGLTVRYGSTTATVSLTYRAVTPGGTPVPADSVSPRELAPGSIFVYIAYGAACEAAARVAGPWPETLGGCRLRLNGRELPLGQITRESAPGLAAGPSRPAVGITTQIPYDAPAGDWELEMEDRAGRRPRLLTAKQAVAPVVRGIQGVDVASGLLLRRQPGQAFTILVSGLGRVAGEGPWGALPAGSVSPEVPVRVFVGGRPARLVSAELSRTEVGVFAVTAETPELGSAVHLVTLGVGQELVAAGSLLVEAMDGSLVALQNGASYTTGVVAPGGVITLYGNRIGPDALTTFDLDSSGRIPSQLGGVRVYFNGIPAPVLYASSTQTSVIAPFGLAGQTTAKVSIESEGSITGSLLVPVRPADPGLFSFDRSGTGPGAILNQDGTLNSAANPARPGSIVVLFGAGFGAIEPLAEDGEITGVANLPVLRAPVSATVGGAAAVIEYAGPAPGAVAGLYQVNLRMPASIPPGAAAVRVMAGEAASQAGFTVAVGGQ